MKDTEQLTRLLREHYTLLNHRHVVAIYARDLADQVYAEIDPEEKAPLLVKHAAILELRSLSGMICKSRSGEDVEDKQESLFDGLQPRYPAKRGEDIASVLRGELTLEERRQNSQRLRQEAVTKTKHADLLDAETDDLIRRGILAALPNNSTTAAEVDIDLIN